MSNNRKLHQKVRLFAAVLLAPFVTCSLTFADSEFPRITIDQLVYEGAFRFPKESFGASSVNYSNGAIGFRADRHSLYVSGHENESSIAEFAIPKLSKAASISALPVADAPIQPFTNILDRPANRPDGQLIINGIQVSNDSLLVNAYRFYDQSPFNEKTSLVLQDADAINSSPISGYFSLAGFQRAAGWLSPVPEEWSDRLGGDHLTGFSNSTRRAMIHSSSVGPSAYSLDLSTVVLAARENWTAPTSRLLDYPLDHNLAVDGDLYNTSGRNDLWTHASEVSFGLAVPQTSTFIAIGMSGGHDSGMSYGDPPYGGYKGHYTIDREDKYGFYWLYDLNDLVKGRKGTRQAYDIRPYASGVLPSPVKGIDFGHFSGGTFDPETRMIYLSIRGADTTGGFGSAPIVVAYRLNLDQ